MNNLVPCPTCNRHVRSAEVACPFCSADLPESIRPQGSMPRPPGRLSRAALVTAGAAALIGVESCSATPAYGAPSGFGGNTSTIDGGSGGASGNDGAPSD